MTGSSSEGTAALSVASPPATSSRLAELADAAAVAGIPANLLRSPRHLEVLIPARNEAQRLPRTLMRTVEYLEAQPYSSSVVVVDNDSVDQTVDLASQVRSDRVLVNVIGCAQRGKGAAVRRGILTSRARFLGYMDADLATPIETLDFVLPLLETDCQAVVGSRRVGGAVYAERQPAHRVVSSMIFRTVASRVAPGFADTQCGFKFFAGDLARAAARRLRIDGFAFDVELLRAVTEMGVAVKEIPVVWSDRKGSTLRVLDGARAVADVLHLARRRAA
jgi:dolichyl-phosphate beta-glucosyltransferase